MKVVAVRIYVVVIGGRHPVLAEVLTDQGLSGLGEAAVAYGTGAWAAARVYANGWSFRCVTPDDFAREARRVVQDGFTALKFYPLASAELDEHGHIRHVSHRSVSRDVERLAVSRVRAVREAVGLHAPHNCASPVSTAAALQLDACIPNFLIQELYPYRIPDHFAIVDRAPELEVRGGMVAIPDRPGLGVELAEERVRPFLWAECRAS